MRSRRWLVLAVITLQIGLSVWLLGQAVEPPSNSQAASSNALTVRRYSGTAQEMATAWGRDEKARFARIYEQVLAANQISALTEQLLYVSITRYETYIDAESIGEMKAFSQACGIRYEQVLLLNCFYDQISCRQVVAWGAKTKDGRLLHARNLDWYDYGDALRTNNVLLIRQYPTGHATALLTWPGCFGSLTGCNDQKLSLAYNLLGGGQQRFQGEPVFLMLNRVLRQAVSVDQAVGLIQASQFCTDGSIMIASARERKAVVVDIQGKQTWVRSDRDVQFIVNDNTCYFDIQGRYKPNKYTGSPTYRAALAAGPIDVPDLQRVMANPKVLLSMNLLTAIFDLSQNCVYVAWGRYEAAHGPYQTFELFAKP